MRNCWFKFSLICSVMCVLAAADPLNQSMELGSSISQSLDARNVLVNPAALGYETDLNGSGLTSSFDYGINRGFSDEFSTSLALGYFGFGWEYLSIPAGRFKRYHFGLGFPLSPYLYFGGRLVLQRPETLLIGDYNCADLGLQFRPSDWVSIGFMANRLNQPTILGAISPIQWVGGITFRPKDWLMLSMDLDTPSNQFLKNVGYQGTVSVEPIRGLFTKFGYHKDYQFQVGLAWNLENASARSTFQPKSDTHRLVSGFSVSPVPYRSVITKISALKIDIDSSLSAEGVKGGLFSADRPSLLDLLERIKKAEETHVPLVIFKIENFPLGLASAQEVFEAISRLRAKGIRTEVFLGNAGLKEYLIASAADVIHMEKSASLGIVGLKSEGYYLKGTLDKIGVEGEFLARGEYKSAPEMFTRKEASGPAKQAIMEELDEAEAQILPY